ncbi:uncharacterized protein VTP21DRAFT_1990 [Calcarisporiella thermophila]|uniref:uncharacterized protein n=1 Tax=Calcarisporiella thermophila TaxID=911321 RepID=UPI0037420C14
MILAAIILLTSALGCLAAEGSTSDGKNIEGMALFGSEILYTFKYEIAIVAFLVVYFINYSNGFKKNQALAKRWMSKQLSLFQDQFSLVGDGEGHSLLKDGPADYIFYLSGRVNCKYVHGKVKLKPRHDLVIYIWKTISNLIGNGKEMLDTVTFDVTMNDNEYENFVFAVVHKTRTKEAKESNFAVSKFSKQGISSLLPSSFNIFSEAAEITDVLLNSKVVETIKKYESQLLEIVISDMPRVKPEKDLKENYPKRLRVTFKLPQDNQLDSTCELSELVFFLIDALPKNCASFRADTKKRLRANREELRRSYQKQLELERIEEAQKKRDEKKKAEKERIAKLSPEEQRKHEERERQKELRKRQKKMMVRG